MKANQKNVGKWLRWIGSAALVLALAGLFTPATSSAVINDDPVSETETVGHEVIPVEGTAPTPLPTAPWTPGGYTGGGSGSPSGPGGETGGGGGISSEDADPSDGGSKKVTKRQRIQGAKDGCVLMEGTWSPAIFNDIDTNVELKGYVCRYRFNNQYNWWYYDSEGFLNQHCSADVSQEPVCTADHH